MTASTRSPSAQTENLPIVVAALYHFTAFDALPALRDRLQSLCDAQRVRGTLLLASEGLNGTIAGTREGIDAVLAGLRALPGCDELVWKESFAAELPFHRMKVRLKREIVTMGVEGVDPAHRVGRYVRPEDWNDLIAREDVVVIDTRNDYEIAIGSFEGAIDPGTGSFREFPDWWRENAEAFAGKTLAMFCTGGIRCEKATSWLVEQGVADVRHLQGGILKYLEEVPEERSLWNGECFVFDQRVSVGHGLRLGGHGLCHACRRPVSDADRASADFEEGVSCPHCIGDYTDADRARFRERQRQMELARARGESHIGQSEKTRG